MILILLIIFATISLISSVSFFIKGMTLMGILATIGMFAFLIRLIM